MTYLFLLGIALQAAPSDTVIYSVSFENAGHHEASVDVEFTGVPFDTLELRMSRSSPGRYALHEFAKNVYGFEAFDGAGRPLDVTRPNPHQWNVTGHDGTVRVRYLLFADRIDGTYSAVDRTHAHLNMPATVMWARNMEDRPIRVTFTVPENSRWKAATQLAPTADPLTFEAPDLYYLLDSPVELSDHQMVAWAVRDVRSGYTLRLAVHHRGSKREVERYAALIRAVVEEQLQIFGEYAPFDFGSYTFLADYLPYAAGDGMEHRNSTVLTSSTSLSTNTMNLLNTVSHEFFHSWNVERFRPRSLEPFNFERANVSGELWLAEGFTSYYDDLILKRAGLLTFEQYARGLSARLNTVLMSPGRRYFSPVGMSRLAPLVDAAASIDPTNRPNTFISYYTWGDVIALGLDLILRRDFVSLTLDDYMRKLWQNHGRTEIPYTMDDLEEQLAEVTGSATFASEFFQRYVKGRNVPDFEGLLLQAGLVLRKANPDRAVMGVALRDVKEGVLVAGPTIGGTSAYEAGLDNSDVILSVDGRPATSSALVRQIIRSHEPGDVIAIEFRQRGVRRSASMTLFEDSGLDVVTFEALGREVTERIEEFRHAWLDSAGP